MVKTVDAGKFDDNYFMVGISIGFGADLVKGADRAAKNKNGLLAYFFSAIAAFKGIKRVNYNLKIDENEFNVKGVTCIIANAGNLGFTRTSLDKHIDICDGLLDVVVVRRASLKMFKHIFTTLIKRERPHDLQLVQHWQGREITVSTSRRQVVQCDGEVLENMPSRITVVPGAIKVVVP